jgi:endonuclease/exonuclease/phosphatase (EEP) superfamily protein YafD
VAGCAFGTALGFLGAWHWVLDLFSHFRIQYFWVLLAVGAYMFLLRRRAWAVTSLALAAVNAALILPFYLSRPAPLNHGTGPLRVMLVNVNYQTGSPQKVLDTIRAHDPDFIVLQEITHAWFSAVAPALSNGYPHCERELREDPFGIGLWSKHPFTGTVLFFGDDYAIPSIVADITTPHGNLAVIATHPLPPIGGEYSSARDTQLAQLARRARGPDAPLLLIGDLNATPWCAAFRSLLRDSGLRNSAQGRGLFPTWPAPFPAFLRIPIDHILHTPDIEILSRQTGPRVRSDHLPVIVGFRLPPKMGKMDVTGMATGKKGIF